MSTMFTNQRLSEEDDKAEDRSTRTPTASGAEGAATSSTATGQGQYAHSLRLGVGGMY